SLAKQYSTTLETASTSTSGAFATICDPQSSEHNAKRNKGAKNKSKEGKYEILKEGEKIVEEWIDWGNKPAWSLLAK
ncbi:11226_t:CDS:2, partial [Dentiscutata erythropus]